jgi:hypothetical protein
MNLPFIDENAINKDNIIVVDMPKDGINYKSGMPLLPTETVTVTRRELVEGVPALVVSTGAEIARLESEPAYYRRDRTLKEQKAARQSANENLQI